VTAGSQGTVPLATCKVILITVMYCQGGGVERPTPLAARIRESTEEERAETAAWQADQEELQAPARSQWHGSLPPVLGAEHVGGRGSTSTGSTGSTERSADPQWPAASDKTIGAAAQAKLAMDALERKDYELLALITQAASSTLDSPSMHRPGGPRAPGTPTNPHGSAPYSNGHSRHTGRRASIQAEHISTHSSRPESAPTNCRNADGTPPIPYGSPQRSRIQHRPVSSETPVSSKALAHGWGTPSKVRYVDPEEVESIVQRSNKKLIQETRRMKSEFEGRIAELESKSAWTSESKSAWTEVSQLRSWEPPGLASKRATKSLHGGGSPLRAEFDSVAMSESSEPGASAGASAGPASGDEWEVRKSKSRGITMPELVHEDGVSHAKQSNGHDGAVKANASSTHDEDELETLHNSQLAQIHHATSSGASHTSGEQVLSFAFCVCVCFAFSFFASSGASHISRERRCWSSECQSVEEGCGIIAQKCGEKFVGSYPGDQNRNRVIQIPRNRFVSGCEGAMVQHIATQTHCNTLQHTLRPTATVIT